MLTNSKITALLILILVTLSAATCKQESTTEAEFIDQQIFTTGMDTRVNGLQDLLYFSAQQQLNACQDKCEELKAATQTAEKNVAALEELLFERIGGIKPPPPPCPCETGNCLWAPRAVFSYFVDTKKFTPLPEVTVQTLNGSVISSSEKAKVTYSPEGERFALVQLPQQEFKDKAVKMVITAGNETAEVLVNIK